MLSYAPLQRKFPFHFFFRADKFQFGLVTFPPYQPDWLVAKKKLSTALVPRVFVTALVPCMNTHIKTSVLRLANDNMKIADSLDIIFL